MPVDPTIYRFYELIQVYGPTIKALIHEEFGDGIMSAIDFDMEIKRKEDPKGDCVVVTLNGKISTVQEVLNCVVPRRSPHPVSENSIIESLKPGQRKPMRLR